jgi:hypothetical protein
MKNEHQYVGQHSIQEALEDIIKNLVRAGLMPSDKPPSKDGE